uniref:Uncharacterized protein n=1 Tax=Ciona savignyi TaxID=51511 RepID=H2ZDL0_CIOSA
MGSMGTFHSTMSCDRLSYSFQNCFGYPETGATYENNDTTKPSQAFCNGSIGAGGKHDLVENAPTRRRSRKSSKSRDSCCTGSTATDVDGSAYDLYSPPNHGRIDCRRCDSINSHHSINTVSTMNSIPTKRTDLGSPNYSNGASGFHKTSESSVDPPSFGKKNTNNNVNKNHQSAKPVTRNTVECLTTNNNSQA